jgi:hypothetical protein
MADVDAILIVDEDEDTNSKPKETASFTSFSEKTEKHANNSIFVYV